MINTKKQSILKNKYKNIIFIKYEIKYLILKSIIHNNFIKNKYKLYANLLKNKKNKKNKKICVLSGSYKSININFNLTKHNVNFLSKLGLLQNFKINSW